MSSQINNFPKVAVWGSYLWGNFGDDVMAIIISRHLKEKGFHPVVYKLDSKLANYYGISSESDVDVLLSGSVACIVGGGGLLCSSNIMDDEWKTFYFALLRNPIPVHFCSIGGDGNSSLPMLTLYVTKVLMLPNIKSATVRLESDMQIFKEIKVPCEFHPDIILSSPKFFPIKSKKYTTDIDKKNRKLSFIINLPKCRRFSIFSKLINLASGLFNIEVTYLRTHLSWLQTSEPPFLDYEYIPSVSHEQTLVYENVEQVRDALLNSDLIISSKLHAGVFALSYGVPFISINGAKKTKSFLDQAEINSSLTIGRFYLLKLFLLIVNRQQIIFLIDATKQNSRLVSLMHECFGHFNFLDRFLSEHLAR